MSADHIHFFLNLRSQIKLYHWQTFQYARHKATDSVLEEIDDVTDSFVEIYFGKHGRTKLSNKYTTVTLKNMSDKEATAFVKSCITYLIEDVTASLDAKKDTDLLSLRDELIGHLNQLLYLFTLH
jgi:hypothetical protein